MAQMTAVASLLAGITNSLGIASNGSANNDSTETLRIVTRARRPANQLLCRLDVRSFTKCKSQEPAAVSSRRRRILGQSFCCAPAVRQVCGAGGACLVGTAPLEACWSAQPISQSIHLIAR